MAVSRRGVNRGSETELEELLAEALSAAAADPFDPKTDPRTTAGSCPSGRMTWTGDPSEIIYVVAETNEVMCRRWNWRNGYPTRITEDTRALVMNIDGLGPGNEAHTVVVRDHVSRMLERYCGAETALPAPGAPYFEFRR